MTQPTPAETPASFQPSALSTEAAADVLGASEWGERMGRDQILALTRYFRPYHVARGVALCEEGDPGLYMGVLVSGFLKVGKRDYFGEEKNLGGVEPGSTFGEIAFLDGQPRSASLRATEEAEILLLTRSAYEALTSEEPALAVALLQQMCRCQSARLRRLTDRSVQHLL